MLLKERILHEAEKSKGQAATILGIGTATLAWLALNLIKV